MVHFSGGRTRFHTPAEEPRVENFGTDLVNTFTYILSQCSKHRHHRARTRPRTKPPPTAARSLTSVLTGFERHNMLAPEIQTSNVMCARGAQHSPDSEYWSMVERPQCAHIAVTARNSH